MADAALDEVVHRRVVVRAVPLLRQGPELGRELDLIVLTLRCLLVSAGAFQLLDVLDLDLPTEERREVLAFETINPAVETIGVEVDTQLWLTVLTPRAEEDVLVTLADLLLSQVFPESL